MSEFSIYDELIRKLIESEPDITTQDIYSRLAIILNNVSEN